MLAFNNDYSHGAHPAVLQALVDTNMEPQPGTVPMRTPSVPGSLSVRPVRPPMPTCFFWWAARRPTRR